MRGAVKGIAVIQGLGALVTLGAALLFGAVSVGERGIDAVVVVLLTLIAALGLLQGAIAVGLWRHRVWARTGAITLAVVVALTGAGLIPAIVTLIVLLHPDGRALFIPPAAGPEGSAPSLD